VSSDTLELRCAVSDASQGSTVTEVRKRLHVVG
jgi:hypothetical protein